MKKKILLSILMVLVLATLTGCGASIDNSETNEATDNTTTTTTTTTTVPKIPTLELGKMYVSNNDNNKHEITLNIDNTFLSTSCVEQGGCVSQKGTYEINGVELILISKSYDGGIGFWENLPEKEQTPKTYTITSDNVFTINDRIYEISN